MTTLDTLLSQLGAFDEYEVWRMGQTNPLTMPVETFAARLAVTIAWCNFLEERAAFRGTAFPAFHRGFDNLVTSVGQTRQGWFTFSGLRLPLPKDLCAGELLVYFPDMNLSDGAAEVASRGFFDVYNTPPSDTWVAAFDDGPGSDVNRRHSIVCYVPAFFVDDAARGIDVNPEQCIAWLRDTNGSFSKRFG